MGSSPKIALQKAIYTALMASPFQTACGLVVGVYDHIPANAKAPYVVIGDIQTDGSGTQHCAGSDLHANITVWSTKPGKVELETIAHQVRTFLGPEIELGAPFTLEGHRLVSWLYHQTVPMDDPDGISTKAIVKLEYLTEPLS